MPPRLTLTKEQIDKMKGEFIQLDMDGDGIISTDELAKVLRAMKKSLGVSESDIKRTLRDTDKNGDGTIDVEEYTQSRKYKSNRDLLHRALVARYRIRKEFESFDEDASGYITKEEFIAAIRARVGITVSLRHTEKIIQEMDCDDDGRINYEEFMMLMIR